ncbi:hypothetical protein IAU59_000347 [Kwoniella sp. CBS 9459]
MEAVTSLICTTAPAMASAAGGWALAHPYKTGFYAVTGFIWAAPAVVATPFLGFLGFTAVGPAPGSLAASVQTANTAAGSTFAILEGAAMGGNAIVTGAVAGGAAIAAGTKFTLDLLK